MGTIKLSSKQEVSFKNFLEWATKEEPKNYSEWGEDYLNLCILKDNIKDYLKDGVLQMNKDDDMYWSVHNYLSAYVYEIADNQLGVELFDEYKELFIYFHQFTNSFWDYTLFVPQSYESSNIVIEVNPLHNPEMYL